MKLLCRILGHRFNGLAIYEALPGILDKHKGTIECDRCHQEVDFLSELLT